MFYAELCSAAVLVAERPGELCCRCDPELGGAAVLVGDQGKSRRDRPPLVPGLRPLHVFL